MSYILVGVGGFFGGLCRFQLGKVFPRGNDAAFPLATFLVNVTGAFLLGWLTGSGASGNAYLLVGDGFLGAYTTFSTLMFEHHHLAKQKEHLRALLYLAGTVATGVLGYAAGYML